MIHIVIPIDKWTFQLARTIDKLSTLHNDIDTQLHIMERPDLNVAECRQLAMSSFGRYVCFLDYDSEMIHDHWLDYMWELLNSANDVKAVFGTELWGTEYRRPQRPNGWALDITTEVLTPAACMLVDTDLSDCIFWDQNIGLRNGWLGGDFEEVDFCFKLQWAKYKILYCAKTSFHHTGGKSSFAAFQRTDRAKSVNIMGMLLMEKYHTDPDNNDFFKGLTYLKADPLNDNMLATGCDIRKCYSKVIQRNNIKGIV